MKKFSFLHLLGGRLKAEDENQNDENTEAEDKEETESEGAGAADNGNDDDSEDNSDDTEANDDAGDDEDQGEDEGADAKAARKKERARIAQIFASPAAAANLPLTCHIAFNTDMPAKQGIAALEAGEIAAKAQGKRGGLAAAMARQPQPSVGTGGAQPDASVDAGWDRAIGRVHAMHGGKPSR